MNKSESLTDQEIIQLLSQGREEEVAIKYLYRTHFEFLGRYVVNNSGSEEDARDIFQEVVISFVNLVRADKFRGDSSIRTFLFALNRNIWLNELKKRGRAAARELRYGQVNPQEEKQMDHILEHRETQQALYNSMDHLGEHCKKILLLYYYENLSMKEILEQVPYENEQVVRNRKYKCLKQLQDFLSRDRMFLERLKSFLNG